MPAQHLHLFSLAAGFAALLDHHAPTQLSIGVSMLGELCAAGKALHTGLPFAPRTLSNGRHGTT